MNFDALLTRAAVVVEVAVVVRWRRTRARGRASRRGRSCRARSSYPGSPAGRRRRTRSPAPATRAGTRPGRRAPAASAIKANARLAGVVGRNGAPCGGRRTRCGRSSLAGPVSGMFLMASPRVRWWWLDPGAGERIRATSPNGLDARNDPGKSSTMTMPDPTSRHLRATDIDCNFRSILSSQSRQRANFHAWQRAARTRVRSRHPVEHARPARRRGPPRRRVRRPPVNRRRLSESRTTPPSSAGPRPR